MELDRVRGDAGLAVEVIPEGDAHDVGSRTRAGGSPRGSHLPLPEWRGLRGAERRVGRLDDHVLRPAPDDEVQVLVGLLAHLRDGPGDAEDVPFERQARGQDAGRPREARQVRNGRPAGRDQARPVLQALHHVALDTAAERRRGARRGGRGGLSHPGDDGSARGDQQDDENSLAQPRLRPHALPGSAACRWARRVERLPDGHVHSRPLWQAVNSPDAPLRLRPVLQLLHVEDVEPYGANAALVVRLSRNMLGRLGVSIGAREATHSASRKPQRLKDVRRN
jgi:hypothetical protein